MAIAPRAFVDQETLSAEIAEIARKLYPDLLRINYSIGDDCSGDAAIHIRVLLSDEAAGPDRLRCVANRVRLLISAELNPTNSWGVLHYVRFRSQSERAILEEPAWA